MVLIDDIDLFESKAKSMISSQPKKTRLTTKFKKEGPVFVMKVTNGPETYKIHIVKEQTLKHSQRLIAQLMHLMTSPELMK